MKICNRIRAAGLFGGTLLLLGPRNQAKIAYGIEMSEGVNIHSVMRSPM